MYAAVGDGTRIEYGCRYGDSGGYGYGYGCGFGDTRNAPRALRDRGRSATPGRHAPAPQAAGPPLPASPFEGPGLAGARARLPVVAGRDPYGMTRTA